MPGRTPRGSPACRRSRRKKGHALQKLAEHRRRVEEGWARFDLSLAAAGICPCGEGAEANEYRRAVWKKLILDTAKSPRQVRCKKYSYRAALVQLVRLGAPERELEGMVWKDMLTVMREGGYEPSEKETKDGVHYTYPIHGIPWTRKADNGNIGAFYRADGGGLRLAAWTIQAIRSLADHPDELTEPEAEHAANFAACIAKRIEANKENSDAKKRLEKEVRGFEKEVRGLEEEVRRDEARAPRGGEHIVRSPRRSEWRHELALEYGDVCALKGTREATEGCHLVDCRFEAELRREAGAAAGIHDVGNGIVLDRSIHALFDADDVLLTPSGELWMRRADTLAPQTLEVIKAHLASQAPPRVELTDKQQWFLRKRNALRLAELITRPSEHRLRIAALEGRAAEGGYLRGIRGV